MILCLIINTDLHCAGISLFYHKYITHSHMRDLKHAGRDRRSHRWVLLSGFWEYTSDPYTFIISDMAFFFGAFKPRMQILRASFKSITSSFPLSLLYLHFIDFYCKACRDEERLSSSELPFSLWAWLLAAATGLGLCLVGVWLGEEPSSELNEVARLCRLSDWESFELSRDSRVTCIEILIAHFACDANHHKTKI